jgi:hypothetical protein
MTKFLVKHDTTLVITSIVVISALVGALVALLAVKASI